MLQLKIDFEVIVVDNASTDNSVVNVKKHFADVKIIQNSKNMGFGAANNCGIKEACGEFILLLNPDTVVLDEAISKTITYLRMHPNIKICGCKILFPDGSIQRSVRSFPTLWNVFSESTFLYLLFHKSELFGEYYQSNFDYETPSRVDWVLGAFMLIRREVFDVIGGFDNNFFMYSEEVDFCYRAQEAGFETWYIPYGQIIHYWGGANEVNRRVILWTNASQMLYFQKHFKGINKILIICIKYGGIVIRIPLYFIVGCVSFKKDLILKSYYMLYTAIKLISPKWKYRADYTGEIQPWET